MALRIQPFDEAAWPALEGLLLQAWPQSWRPELARKLADWRYRDRSAQTTWLAFDGDRCVAMLDSILRPYLLDGHRILVRETCDWFCLPEYRPLGLGISLMRKMMALPEPLLSIGGTNATLALLPRLRWTALPPVQFCVLPNRARGLAGMLLRRKWPAYERLANAIPGSIPLWLPRGARAPGPGFGTASIRECRPETVASLPLPRGDGLVQLLEEPEALWFGRMPRELARPLGLLFLLDDRPVGYSLSQIEPTASGLNGCILHLQVVHPAQEVVDWVVAGTARALAGKGVGFIRCRASTPEKERALRRAGFLFRKPCPSYWWSNQGIPAPALLDAGYLRADDAVPFPMPDERHLAGAARPAGPGRGPVLRGAEHP